MINNILFISIDNLRFDCVSFQPYQKELGEYDVLKYLHTPTLDAIAEKSLCFTQCISTNTYTTASHASIMTGRNPPRHGVRGFFDTKLNPSVNTIGEVLKDEGYRTILYTDVPEVFSNFLGLQRGFDLVKSKDDQDLFELLEGLGDEKVFLFAHFFDVHEPFMHNTNDFRAGSNEDYLQETRRLYEQKGIREEFDEKAKASSIWRKLVRVGPLQTRPIDVLLPLYIKGATKFDTGRFTFFMDSLSRIGFLDQSLQVIFSDHGEGRGKIDNKELFCHAGELYDNVIRVPLMLSHPDLRPGIDDSLISTTDIMPTVITMLGLDSEPLGFDGIDMLSDSRENCYSETWTTPTTFEDQMNTANGLGTIVQDRPARWEGVRDPESVSDRPEFVLNQMALRTEKRKDIKWRRGKKDDLINIDAQLSDAHFVKLLYKELLGRSAEPRGLEYHLNLLEKESYKRIELVNHFLNLDEYKRRVDVRYDLENDPQENHPSESFDQEDLDNFDLIDKISSDTVFAETIFKGDSLLEQTESSGEAGEDDEEVIKSLQDLGYF